MSLALSVVRSLLALLEDHPRLMGRWYAIREARAADVGLGHVVEVVDVREGRALVVTVFSSPMLHWWVPVQYLVTHPLVFSLGHATEFRWLHEFAWVVAIDPDTPGLEGVWRIHRISGTRVSMYNRVMPGDGHIRGNSCSITDLRDRFRQATPEEQREARAVYGDLPNTNPMGEQYMLREEDYAEDIPVPPAERTQPMQIVPEEAPPEDVPAPSTWDRLSGDD